MIRLTGSALAWLAVQNQFALATKRQKAKGNYTAKPDYSVKHAQYACQLPFALLGLTSAIS
ncbi:MAG: hypothetical protein ABIO24_10820 [Saprospiraceae bacterium]